MKIGREPWRISMKTDSTAHSAYIKHSQEEAAILRDLVDHIKANYPLDPLLESACNTKKDKIQQTQSRILKNKVEAHPRKVKSSLKNKDHVIEPKGTAPVQHSKLNANSDLKCVKLGNACPLTRITTTTEVPLYKSSALENKTPKLSPTLVYSRKPRKSKTSIPVNNYKVIKSVTANNSEPSQSWGSIVSNVPSFLTDDAGRLKLSSVQDPTLHDITPATITSGLVPNLILHTIVPLRELTGYAWFNHFDQDAPSPSNSQTTPKTEPPVILNDVKEDNHDIEGAHMGNDPYFGVPIPEIPSDQSSSSDQFPLDCNYMSKLFSITTSATPHCYKPRRIKIFTQAVGLKQCKKNLNRVRTLKYGRSYPDQTKFGDYLEVDLTKEGIDLKIFCSSGERKAIRFFSHLLTYEHGRNQMDVKLVLLMVICWKEVMYSQTDWVRDKDNPITCKIERKLLWVETSSTRVVYMFLRLISKTLQSSVDPTLFIRRDDKELLLDSSIALTTFADADHASCQDTRRNTSGSMQLFGDRLLAGILKDIKALRYPIRKLNILLCPTVVLKSFG
ncbi:hypothetical protein Tco_0475583 [Tanacetum coccineum]